MNRCLRIIDTTIGKQFSFEVQGFIGDDDFDKVSSDTMNMKEWESYRERERVSVDPIFDWLQILANRESRKFLVYQDLLEIIGISERLLDFGCGQGHIGLLLMLRGNSVRFCDYTKVVLPGNLYLTSSYFFTADFNNFNSFDEFDTVLLTQVDYIFSAGDLQKFLTRAFKHRTRVIIISTQLVGPIRFFWNRINLKYRMSSPRLKRHGFLRSLGMYKDIGKQVGYGKVNFRKSKASSLWSYSYIIFDL